MEFLHFLNYHFSLFPVVCFVHCGDENINALSDVHDVIVLMVKMINSVVMTETQMKIFMCEVGGSG